MKFGAATNIVVVQYDPLDIRRPRPEIGEETPEKGRFKVINRIEVPKSEMHYDTAVQLIKKLNEQYHPFAIYCDRGAGEYQIELLRKELGDIVQGVHLGSYYEVRDPISRIRERKPLKPFLVNQTTLLLERGLLRIPSIQVEDTLHRQMTNYQVVKISSKTKEPVYSSTDEHSLDAMMFALFAFMEKYPDLVNTIYSTEAATATARIRSSLPTSLDALRQSAQSRMNNKDDLEWDEPGPPPVNRRTPGTRPKAKSAMLGGNWGDRSQMGRLKRPIKRKNW